MIIYSEESSPRLLYTLKLIFTEILKIDYHLETNIISAKNYSELVINYSTQQIENSFTIIPSGLLKQTNIIEQQINVKEYSNIPCLFYSKSGDLPFDIFSSVFYLVSRYEEYLPFVGDKYGRYKAENSVAGKFNFVHLPIVEIWCKLLAEKLKIPFPLNNYKHKLTIDIDNAWKHKNKGLARTCGGLFKLLFTGNITELIEKIKVLSGFLPDPAESFNYIHDVESRLSEPIQYFILAGTKGKNDRAISVKNKEYRKLLKELNSKKSVGIHPSYLSFFSKDELEKEYFSLCAVFANKITKSRQHYLMLKFPETYRNSIKLGIREDYSLGWSSRIGYRAGISRPFYFYDLLAERETHLKLVPFAAMDRTLKDYMNLTPEKALTELKQLIDITKSIGGEFVMVWHNDSLSDKGEWKEWKTIFEQAIEYAEPNKIS